ncbi:MBL fold metallo-hydrolase [Pararhodonellum marinum]|uniref:MBL fold metallo-hydrolase n=1 Tax=Pararhodonellum marinum TaxID=2755358 RepID=UPI001890224D|nr:MBL fold metallo-hydrolase [Pararhodonellum marinum]
MSVFTLDLHFQNTLGAIASYLVETDIGPVLIESGPESTYPQLERGLREKGYFPEDIQYVFLTHIHFDHAGAAWKLAEKGAKIVVHPLGAPHLMSPEKLWNSAAQIYGDEMENLWGKMEAIPKASIQIPEDGEIVNVGNHAFQAIFTPGHAAHHIAWKYKSILFTGDVAGVKIGKGPVVPPCPPPDIHVENWVESIEKIRKINPQRLYLTHFGIVDDVENHLSELEQMLMDWAAWIRIPFEADEDQATVIPRFKAYAKQQLIDKACDADQLKVYEYANPSWISVAGLYRYWKLKSQHRI